MLERAEGHRVVDQSRAAQKQADGQSGDDESESAGAGDKQKPTALKRDAVAKHTAMLEASRSQSKKLEAASADTSNGFLKQKTALTEMVKARLKTLDGAGGSVKALANAAAKVASKGVDVDDLGESSVALLTKGKAMVKELKKLVKGMPKVKKNELPDTAKKINESKDTFDASLLMD